MTGVVNGPDQIPRCPWSLGSAELLAYHDQEWGRPVRDDVGIYEKLCLEAFQSGLSWLTILRKRQNFRAAFRGFDPVVVAAFGPDDVARLLADQGIVRNRAKIEAAISNARAMLELPGGLADTVWSYAEDQPRVPVTLADVPSWTPASKALSTHLRRHGFRFTGPVTAYAMMQACGIVNDHLADCFCLATGSAATREGEATPRDEVSLGASPPVRPKPSIAQLGVDLTALRWQRSGRGPGSFEVAFVGAADHFVPAAEAVTEGPAGGRVASQVTDQAGYPKDASAQWVLLRVAGDPAARVLIYDRIEWESFVDGAAKGEFDAAAGQSGVAAAGQSGVAVGSPGAVAGPGASPASPAASRARPCTLRPAPGF